MTEWYGLVVYGELTFAFENKFDFIPRFENQYSRADMIRFIISVYGENFENIDHIKPFYDEWLNSVASVELFGEIDPNFIEYMRNNYLYDGNGERKKIYMFSHEEIQNYIEKC